jgi:ABC-type multidrug transport system fused ATPase/permease subunit
VSSFSSELLSLIGAVGGFIVLWYGGWQIIKDNFTIGGYIAFTGYLAKLYGPTQILASLGLSLQPAVTALNRISEFFDATGEEDDKDKTVDLLKIDKIEFKDVNFAYEKEEVLKQINFTLNKEDKILITGPNGSGKSTIIKLILALYKVQHGQVLINGKSIDDFSNISIREKISVVSQDIFLFNDTILNNIIYSFPNAKPEGIEEAIKLSGVSDFADKLENKVNTVVGESGKKISGGEKQKVSIARAILKDSDVVIFDEATSHLDKNSREKIKNLFREKFKDKICIVISHKNWEIPEIKKIILLDKGCILKQKI